MHAQRSRKIIFLMVILLIVAASSSIYFTISKFQNVPFPYDAAGRADAGLRIAQDIKAGDMISFLGDTYRQSFWPFFHSWLLAPAFIVFGESYSIARGVSLFCFSVFVLMIYLIGLEMSGKRGHWSGLVNVCLALTSLPILILSAMSMGEIPGLMMTFITFLFYLKALKQKKLLLYICTSVFMTFTFFTKWHHGVFVIGAVLLTQLTNKDKLISRVNYSLFVPFFIFIMIWFIYPEHIFSFYHHSTFQPHYYEFFSLQNWLFYPKSFYQIYHSSWIIAVIISCGFIYSLKDIKDPRIRLFAIHILIGLVLMTVKLDNRHRYIITIVPSIWILGSVQLVDIWHSFKQRIHNSKIRISLAAVMISGILTISFFTVREVYHKYPVSLQRYNFYADEKSDKAYKFISESVDGHDHIAVFGSWDYYNSLNISTIKWNIDVKRADNLILRNNKKDRVNYYFRRLLKRKNHEAFKDFIYVLQHKDIIVEEYHLLSFMKVLDKDTYQEFRSKTSINPFSDKIINVHSIDPRINCLITIYNEKEDTFNRYARAYLSSQEEWNEFKKEQFSDLGITVTIYKKKGVPESI